MHDVGGREVVEGRGSEPMIDRMIVDDTRSSPEISPPLKRARHGTIGEEGRNNILATANCMSPSRMDNPNNELRVIPAATPEAAPTTAILPPAATPEAAPTTVILPPAEVKNAFPIGESRKCSSLSTIEFIIYIYIYQVEEGRGSTTLMSANQPSHPATLHSTEFPLPHLNLHLAEAFQPVHLMKLHLSSAVNNQTIASSLVIILLACVTRSMESLPRGAETACRIIVYLSHRRPLTLLRSPLTLLRNTFSTPSRLLHHPRTRSPSLPPLLEFLRCNGKAQEVHACLRSLH
jgi:hypothetical protein